MKGHIVTGLDIGTSSIKFLVASKREEGDFEVLSKMQKPSSGIRRDVVVNPEEVSRILQNSVFEIKDEIGKKIDSVYVNIGGSHLFCAPSHGTISVSRADQKISEEDISRVLQAAQTFSLPSNKEIFEAIPKDFIIDGQEGIKEPIGLQGVRLEAEVMALGGFAPYIKNLAQAVLNADLQILDMISSPQAAAKSVLTPRQKELGVALLDIGAGNSSLAVYSESDLVYLAVLPIGSANITNDIAVGLKIDVDVAERIKVEYGTCLLKGGNKKEKIEADDESITFSQKQLAGIIGPRILEIFREVNKEIRKIGLEKKLPGGVVLTGGGAKIPGMVELAKKEFHLPCKIGKPKGFSGMEEDPALATVCGLVLSGFELEEGGEGGGGLSFGRGIGSKIKNLFKSFIP